MAIKFSDYIDDPAAEKPELALDIENEKYLDQLLQLVLKHTVEQVH